jgi:hypothetical protein
MLALSNKWAKRLVTQPESGMGYQNASVLLKNGERFENAVIRGGYIVSVGASANVPFSEEDIEDIKVNPPEN